MAKILGLILIIIVSSCKKSANESSFPVLKVYVGVSINSTDTVEQNLTSIGHIHNPDILRNPRFSDYSEVIPDSMNEPIYYYHPKEAFTGTDSGYCYNNNY